MIRLVIASFFLYQTMGDFNDSANISGLENQHRRSKRVIGGVFSDIRQFPWVVTITLTNSQGYDKICSGSIISRNLVLTAAHCLFHEGKLISPKSLTVRAGSSQRSFGGSKHDVLMTRPHEKFTFSEIKECSDDVGLVYVKQPFQIGVDVEKVVLAEINSTVADMSTADFAGWGATVSGAAIVSDLRYVDLTTVNDKFCWSLVKNNCDHETDIQKVICTFNPGKNICTGDSGGSLTIKNTQIGIASMTDCHPIGSGTFKRVAMYRDWIDKNSQDMVKSRKI